MATPYPTAVVPSFSRCSSTSKIARSFCPVRLAARAASSCSACFLLLTFNAGRIASGATRSVIIMGRSEVKSSREVAKRVSAGWRQEDEAGDGLITPVLIGGLLLQRKSGANSHGDVP